MYQMPPLLLVRGPKPARTAKSISNLRNPGEHSMRLFRLRMSEEPGSYLTMKEVSSLTVLSSILASD